MAKTQALRDEFNGTALKASLWTEFTAAGGSTTYNATGASLNYPNPTSTSNDADISSATTWELTNSYILLQVVSAPKGVNSDANFRLRVDATNYLQWQQEDTFLYASSVVAGTQTIRATLTYDPAVHRWWRIREAAGVTYWDTSSDGTGWTNRASAANPITVTALTVLLAAVSFGVDASLSPFTFNRMNLPLAGARLNNIALRPHQFSPGLAR